MIAGHQPDWVCWLCGALHGRRRAPAAATWHDGVCDCCGEEASVTEPRDFGYLRPGWESGDGCPG